MLVGEDSLEANVGHLAALTGGEIFVSAGSDLTQVLEAALRSLRTRHHASTPISGEPRHISVRRAGMTLTAKWQEAGGSTEQSAEMRAVAALAASLVLPALEIENAAQLAEAEGLVTHLTSLILVDEAADVQEGIPAARKVALPAPRLSAGISAASMAPSQANDLICFSERLAFALPPSMDRALRHVDLSVLGATIDWDAAPQRLQAGDLSELDRDVASAIRSAAAITEVVSYARQLNLDPIIFVVGLIARFQSSRSRSAARLAKAILGDFARVELDDIAQALCLG